MTNKYDLLYSHYDLILKIDELKEYLILLNQYTYNPFAIKIYENFRISSNFVRTKHIQ